MSIFVHLHDELLLTFTDVARVEDLPVAEAGELLVGVAVVHLGPTRPWSCSIVYLYFFLC